MSFVLDASVALSWWFRDEQNAYAHGILRRIGHERAIVPSVWLLEVANGVIIAERRGRLTGADVLQIQREVDELPIDLREPNPGDALDRIIGLARTQRLSAYDAAYLELAMREGLPLATQDEALRSAAERVGVPLA